MRMVETIQTKKKIKDKEEKKRRLQDDEPEDMDINMRRDEYKITNINDKNTVFDSCMNEGINTAKSVFDSQAIFNTRR